MRHTHTASHTTTTDLFNLCEAQGERFVHESKQLAAPNKVRVLRHVSLDVAPQRNSSDQLGLLRVWGCAPADSGRADEAMNTNNRCFARGGCTPHTARVERRLQRGLRSEVSIQPSTLCCRAGLCLSRACKFARERALLWTREPPANFSPEPHGRLETRLSVASFARLFV